MVLKWSDDLSTGVSEVDNQHKELFVRINNLLDACEQGKGREEVIKTIDFLEGYVMEHFSMEETYMRKYGYAGYSGHLAEHTEFIKTFSGLKKETIKEGPKVAVVVRLNHLLVEWLINHIRKTDKAMGTFLQSRILPGIS